MTSVFAGRTYSARGADVRVEPRSRPHSGGGWSTSLGFVLLTISPALDGETREAAAAEIAELLNAAALAGTTPQVPA